MSLPLLTPKTLPFFVRNSPDFRMGIRLECGRCSTSPKPPHSGRSRKSRREDRVEPQEDRRIGGVGEDHLRLLVRAVRLSEFRRQALSFVWWKDGMERTTQTRSAGGVGSEASSANSQLLVWQSLRFIPIQCHRRRIPHRAYSQC